MILFNWIGAAIGVVGIAAAFGLGKLLAVSNEGFVLVVMGLVVIPLDLLYRTKSEDGHLLHPSGGGNIWFIPVWCWGIVCLLAGLVRFIKGGG
jgi:hypothetical protein